MQVLNFEVAGMIRRSRRFRYELAKSVSGGLAATSDADFIRIKSHLGAVEAYMKHVSEQPILDLPESSPYTIDLGEPEQFDSLPENEAIVDLMMMYDLYEKEMGHSASARQACGIVSHDLKRGLNLISKMHRFLDEYVANVQPLDLPESAPLRGTMGSGRTGV